MEHLPYSGESPKDRLAFTRYQDEIRRGKNLLQLMEINKAATPAIRASWSARSFTAVTTSQGVFDAIVCNLSYHVQKHGARFASVADMTRQAKSYLVKNRASARLDGGLLKLPGGIYEVDGRIVTFY